MITFTLQIAYIIVATLNSPYDLRLTVYDSNHGNGDDYFATMIPIEDKWYCNNDDGSCIGACPPEWLGNTLIISCGVNLTVYCGDNFGNQQYVRNHMANGVAPVDIFWPMVHNGLPDWNVWQLESMCYRQTRK